jgi:hypothetical protein
MTINVVNVLGLLQVTAMTIIFDFLKNIDFKFVRYFYKNEKLFNPSLLFPSCDRLVNPFKILFRFCI